MNRNPQQSLKGSGVQIENHVELSESPLWSTDPWMSSLDYFSRQVGRVISKALRVWTFHWLPLVACVIVVLYLGSSKVFLLPPPTDETYHLRLLIRKSAHVVEYAVYAFLLYSFVARRFRRFNPRFAILIFFLTLALAGLDEWRQTFITSRSGRIEDVGLDSIGGVFGVVAAWIRVRLGL